MHLEILELDKKRFSGEVNYVSLPGSMGRFEVLTNHAPLVSTLVKGLVYYKQDTKKQSIPIESGIVKVQSNSISVLVGST